MMMRAANSQKLQLEKKQPFKNYLAGDGDEEDVKITCYVCLGDILHGDQSYFLKNTDHGTSVISPEFGNIRKKFFGRNPKTVKKLIDSLYQQTLKAHPDSATALHEVYIRICEQPMIARAADFHIYLGHGIYLLYSCVECETCPIKPNKWIRCTSLEANKKAGGTEQKGNWHCPKCLYRWKWGQQGEKRLMFIPNSEREGERKKVLIGRTTTDQDHTITLLKSAQLLTEVEIYGPDQQTKKTVAVTKQTLVRAIDRLNERCEKRITQCVDHIYIKSASSKEIQDKMILAYCENPSLSLAHPGSSYKALNVPADTTVLSDDDREGLLDVLCCFYDFTKNKPTSNGELQQAWVKAVKTQKALGQFYWTEEAE